VRRSLERAVGLPPEALPIFEALRGERTRLARLQGVPPYVVFQDATLRAMAMAKPQSLDAMVDLPGIGQAKLKRYGEAFLAVLIEQAQG
jgi:ATP-dependent DNA helicase RecQ